jgi:enoyl-CoA hydratase/carnithine racemase
MSGTGGKSFCAGGDVVSLYNSHIGKEGSDPKLKDKFLSQEYTVDYNLQIMKPFQISIWNGYVMGGGVGVSQFSKIRIATEKSLWAMPETAIGFFPDVGASYFLSRVKQNPSLGLYMALTGHRIKGKDLLKYELATHYMTTDKID